MMVFNSAADRSAFLLEGNVDSFDLSGLNMTEPEVRTPDSVDIL